MNYNENEKKTMRIWRIALTMVAVLVSVSCCSKCNRPMRHEHIDTDVNDCADVQMTPIGDTAKSSVYIEIAEPRIPLSADAIEVKITNLSDADIEYGEVYYIEKWEDDKWNRLALDKDTLGRAIAFNLIGYSLTPNASAKKTCNLLKCAFRYSAGKYRIVIPYIQNGIGMKISSEFTFVEDTTETLKQTKTI